MRQYNHEILKEIKDRWSPRAFSSEPVLKEDLEAIMEAARYAPSCFNEQPWRFIIGVDEGIETMRSLLLPKNHKWASHAPVLILIVSKSTFAYNGKENSYHKFDAGTAWGFLSLEATRRGYYTHAMAGFKKKAAREVLGLSEEYVPIAMVALGRPGDIKDLDEEFRENEQPNTRKPINEIVFKVGDEING